MKRGLAFIQDFASTVHVMINALIEEPLRFLTKEFLKRSSDETTPCSWPLMLQMLWPRSSMLKLVQQYLSAVLHLRAPRLHLLCGLLGVQSMTDDEAQKNLLLLRQAALSVSAWLYRRHEMWLATFPIKLLKLGDLRHSVCERMALVAELHDASDCCRGHFGRMLDQQLGVEALAAPGGAYVIGHLAAALDKVESVADIERGHRRSKSILVNDIMNWKQFSAQHVLRESSILAKALQAVLAAEANTAARMEPQMQIDDASPSVRAPLTSCSSHCSKRIQRPVDLYRLDLIQEGKGNDEQINFFSTKGWLEVHRRFEDLPSERKRYFERMSDLSGQRVAADVLMTDVSGIATEMVDNAAVDSHDLQVVPWSCEICKCTEEVQHPPVRPVALSLTARSSTGDFPELYSAKAVMSDIARKHDDLSVGLSLANFSAMASQWRTKRAAEKRFEDLVGHLARDTHIVPDNVAYETLCGPICRSKVHCDLWNMLLRFRAAVAGIASQAHRATKGCIAAQDLLFFIELKVDDTLCSSHLCFLSAAHGRHAHRRATQTFTLCDKDADHGDYIVCFRYAVSDLCVVDMTDFSEEWQCLFKTAQHPPLCHLSEDELFAHVAKPLIERMPVASNEQNVDHGIEQASVTLLGALFKERGHGDFVTSGLDVHRSPVVVKLFPDIRPKAKQKQKQKVPAGPGGRRCR